MLQKKEIRTRYLADRRAMSPKSVRRQSEALRHNLALFLRKNAAELVIGYAPIDNEPDVLPLLDELTVKTALFRVEGDEIRPHRLTDSNDLEIGPYGIRQPKTSHLTVQASDRCFVLVPGIAFSRRGDRVGYGKGYFDRFLAKRGHYAIGVCYDFQVCETLPSEDHDIRMNALITPTSVNIL